jgi:F0F1-type ATP synthase epsilon subunit
MQLTIVTPSKKEHFDIAWVELNTDQGNYVIQPGHAPTFFSLKAHAPFTYCLKNGEQEVIMIKRAMVEVTRAQITLLLADFD